MNRRDAYGLVLLLCCGLASEAPAADLRSLFGGGKSEGKVRSAKPCSFDSIPTNRPGGKGPTQVEIGVRVLDLIAIDDVSQAMTLDFVLFAAWTDHALARPLAKGSSCALPLAKVWNPALSLVGDRRVDSQLESVVVVGGDGSVIYMQRLIGDVRATADLRAFPMDARKLELRIVAAGYSPKEVKFVPSPQRTGLQPNPSVANWIFGRQTTEVSAYSVEEMGAIASFAFSIEARRRAAVYLWRLALPIVLIVLMSWIPFWIPSTEVGARNSLASLAMLNMVAFQFVLRGMLPPVPYMTRADTIATGALVLIFAALVVAAATGVLELRGKGDRAYRVNRISRVLFPVTAVSIVLLAMLS